MSTTFNKGSEWRKWDLHFHTPSSHDYQDKSITNQEIIDGLVGNSISVVAITDHHIIDVERIKDLQKLGKDLITIFPGIEFRSELGGSELMHYIGIFPENADISYIWKQIQVHCKLDDSDIISKGGYDKVFCDFKDTAKLIQKLGGYVSVHAGKKSNTFERLKLDVKSDLEIEGCINILELGKPKDEEDYHKIVFPNIGRAIPLVICSDNHHIKNYTPKENFWVKADSSFAGLKQVIIEPERAFIGDEPPLLKRVKANQTKFIKSLEIEKVPGITLSDVWFDNYYIELNSGLVAIIGNKGSGKSAITDVLSLCGNTYQHPSEFSFLTPHKFRKSKPVNLSDKFVATLTWADGSKAVKKLHENPDPLLPEKVKYIPQNFLEHICTNVDSDEFETELKKIIYSHTPPEQRLGKASLDELITYKSSLVSNEIAQLQVQITTINSEIAILEDKSTTDYKTSLENKLKLKKDELAAHLTTKPHEPPQTTESEETKKLVLVISEIRNKISRLEKEIADINAGKTKLAYEREELHRADQYFRGIEENLNKSLDTENPFVKVLTTQGISISDIVRVEFKLQTISNKVLEFDKKLRELDLLTDIRNPESKTTTLAEQNALLKQTQEQLDKPAKEHQKYLDAIKEWENNKLVIEGAEDVEGSLKFYEKQLQYLEKELPDLLASKLSNRKQLVRELFEKKFVLVTIRKELFQPVTQFIAEFKELQKKYDVKLDVALEPRSFGDSFFNFINQGRIGTFSGKEEGYKKLTEMLERAHLDTVEGVLGFTDEILDALNFDRRDGEGKALSIKSQLKTTKETSQLYDFLFGFEYLQPVYNLKLGIKTLQELSPGERGALLLIFYLILDKDDIPLIIDQPEENLDNESVYHILVHFIKRAKEQRQIIIVTHNPNLAIVCDADQIIQMQIEKENKNTVKFVSGAIENTEINKASLDILEGTLPAFANRDSKYIRQQPTKPGARASSETEKA